MGRFQSPSSRQADSTAAKNALRTSAADLKVLHGLPRVRHRTFKSISGTRVMNFASALLLSEVRVGGSARVHELRKQGTSSMSTASILPAASRAKRRLSVRRLAAWLV